MENWKWEVIEKNEEYFTTYRMRIPVGWIIKTSYNGKSVSMVFVPDYQHII